MFHGKSNFYTGNIILTLSLSVCHVKLYERNIFFRVVKTSRIADEVFDEDPLSYPSCKFITSWFVMLHIILHKDIVIYLFFFFSYFLAQCMISKSFSTYGRNLPSYSFQCNAENGKVFIMEHIYLILRGYSRQSSMSFGK